MKPYSHFWNVSEAFKLTTAQKKLIKEIVNEYKDFIEVEFNTLKGISFKPANGQKGGDFTISYTTAENKGSVDTARHHWDGAVCKVLLVLSLSEEFNFWSEGIKFEEGKFEFDCDWEAFISWFRGKGYSQEVVSALVWTTSVEVEEIEEEAPATAEPHFCGRYEFRGVTDRGNSSAKFWEIHECAEGYKAMWGKIGYGAQGSKIYSYDEAYKTVTKKTQKGYQRVV